MESLEGGGVVILCLVSLSSTMMDELVGLFAAASSVLSLLWPIPPSMFDISMDEDDTVGTWRGGRGETLYC